MMTEEEIRQFNQLRDEARPVPALVARNSDGETAHAGVANIGKKLSKNRKKILALDFPACGLHYREIAELADIYPTTVSRVITSMVQEGSLQIVGERGGRLYAKTEVTEDTNEQE